MHKIISLKKEITFKNAIEEIISISMDNKLFLDDLLVKGDFIVEGEYLNLSKREPFHFDIPYLGYLEENYDTSGANIKVDDFYYEIIEPNKLLLSIDILVDNLSEKKLIEEIYEAQIEENDIVSESSREELNCNKDKREEDSRMNDNSYSEEVMLEDKSSEKEILLFKDNYQESYMTYKVYIVREGDTLENILDKYKITLDILNKYNVINEISVGDKLIIPNEKNK